LAGKLFGHDLFGIGNIQMGKENKTFPRRLVQLNGVALLDEFSNDFALIVFDNQNLLRLDHLLNHDGSQVGQDFGVLVLAQLVVGKQARVACSTTTVSKTGEAAQVQQRIHISHWDTLHLVVEFGHQLRPVLQANLENLAIINLADTDKVEVAVGKVFFLREILNDLGAG
jgi:hypothetical protein